MVNEFISNHGWVIFISAIFLLVLSRFISLSNKYREGKPDPPMIFGPIRGMYVCYQCDTIFNTLRCPGCNEEAVIPLIHLTGSIIENERVAAVVGKLQGSSAWKMPTFPTFQDGQAVKPASRPGASNGGASEVPVRLAVLTSERGRELS
jgi:hypothetical protein